MAAIIIAVAPDGELTRDRFGRVSPQPTFYVEWYDEHADNIRTVSVDGDVAHALAPALFEEALDAIQWRDRVSKARHV